MSTNSRNIALTKEYSPSLNTKRFQNESRPVEAVIAHFIRHCETVTEIVRKKYNLRTDVRYGGTEDNQVLDIYYHGEKECDTDIFVFIHGGFWQNLNKNSSGIFVEALLKFGYRVVAVDYNLCPSVTLRELTEQIQSFFSWLFKYAKETNAKSITICGHSAGGHLALQIFNENVLNFEGINEIENIFMFLISGIYDLRELFELECVNPKNILGLSAETAITLSPQCWNISEKVLQFYSNKVFKMYILVAENDSSTFIGQSRKLAEKFKNNFPVTFHVFPKYDHFDIIEEAALEDSAISQFILIALKSHQ